MQTNQLQRRTKRLRSTQVGRGGSRGKTSGRGHKGQHQHGGHGIRAEIRDAIKKIPKLRGRGVNINTSRKIPAQAVNLDVLEASFKEGETVSPKTLCMKDITKKIGGNLPPVKILATGELKKKLVIADCLVSKAAREKLDKSGSKIK